MNVVPIGRATNAEWAKVQSVLDDAAAWADPDNETENVPDGLYDGLPGDQAPASEQEN